jgi:dihydrolipoamide dehydrogenase
VNMARLSARRESLVRIISGGIGKALRNAGVTVLAGRGSVVNGGMAVTLDDGCVEVEASSVVVAAGARWAVPDLPGISPDRIITADVVQAMTSPPSTALVMGGGPADTAFAVEYAFLLAALGTAVTLAVAGPHIIPALDADLDPAVTDALATFGVEVLRNAADETAVAADVVVATDRRVPLVDGVGLAEAGVAVRAGAVVVDASCRTNVPGVLAAGDVTGGWMTTAAALHTGDVAGAVAAGDRAVTRLRTMPHILHTMPGVGWIGMSEAAARHAGAPVMTAVVDLAANGRAVAMGGRTGYLKVVADSKTGELLGVHVVGPDATELVAVAATAMQAELTVADVAAMVPWHPTMTESLIDAARQLV